IFGTLAAFFVKSGEKSDQGQAEDEMAAGTEDDGGVQVDDEEQAGAEVESYPEIIIRSVKIYLFVMALTFLGEGFKPFIEMYLLDLSPYILYWINMVSAVLVISKLEAADISSEMVTLNVLSKLL